MSEMADGDANAMEEEFDIVIDSPQTPQHAATYIFGVENLHIHEYPSPDNLETSGGQDVLRIAEELKAELHSHVDQISATIQAPVEMLDPISPVTLPMVSAPQRMDDDLNSLGHFHRRDDMKKMYDPHPGDVTVRQIFEWAKRKAEIESRCWFRDENLRRKYVIKYGNVVGVVGQAGIGKTTTAKQWAKKALGENVFGEVSFLFLITTRYLNYTISMTLLQFLVSTTSDEWSCSPEIAHALLKMLSRDPHVLIIIDGIDEAAFESFATEIHHSTLHGVDTAEAFLKNLLAGNILPLARKIVTSRPSQFYNLHPNYRPHFTVQLLGLDRDLQRDLGVQICGEHYDDVEKILRASPNVFAYCFVPINFILTVNYIMIFGTEESFISITRVLSFTCNKFYHTNHVTRTECEIKKLAALAWYGVKNNMIVFSNDVLDSFKLSQVTGNSFLNTCMSSNANPTSTLTEMDRFHCFSHLIWQEKFAAAHLMFDVSLQDFRATVPILLQHRRNEVIMFLYGLFDPISYNQMSSVVGGAVAKDRDSKLACLRNTIPFVLRESTQSSHLLRVCSWLHEANNEPLTAYSAQFLPRKIQLSGAILPVDMSNLVFVIKSIRRPLSISMIRCRMQDNSLEIFARSYGVQTNIWKLNMSYVAFSTEDCHFLALFLHNVTNLLVRDCEIRPNEILILSRALLQLDHRMRYLDLTENKLRIRGAENFAPCIKNIESLDLTKCLMVAEGVSAIASEVEVLQQPMESLCVDENSIGDEGAASMANCLHNTHNLRMCNCGIGSLGADYMSEKIALLLEPMTSLWLSCNKVGDDGARALATSLSKLKELHLDYCYIGNRGAKKIGKELAKLDDSLLCLDLTGNSFSDEGTVWLVRSWRKVKRLIISGCNTSDECRDSLQSQLKNENMLGHVVEF